MAKKAARHRPEWMRKGIYRGLCELMDGSHNLPDGLRT